MNNDNATKAFKDAVSVLKALKLKWWCEAGTCLGIVREGDFIGHDEDIDFGIMYPCDTLMVEEALLNDGWEKVHCFGTPENGYELAFRKYGVKTDFFFFYKDKDILWHSAWLGGKQLFLDFPEYLFGWFKTVEFKGIEVNLPNPPEEYLRLRYGDWKVPNKGWNWATDPECLREKRMKRGTKDEWENVHQPYELDFHTNGEDGFRKDDEGWKKAWDTVFAELFPSMDGLKMLDVGGGSRPPLKGRGKEVTVIEPLYDKLVRKVPSSWLSDMDWISAPAEEMQEKLRGKFDFVLCWNVLDHCYDWRAILRNIHAYMKDDGKFLLATDTRPPCIGHPGVGDRDSFEEYLGLYFKPLRKEYGRFHRDYVAVLEKL